MRLDVTCMQYLSRDDYRVLIAVEMGMKNHEMVPVPLITSIAKLRHGGSYKILSTLLRYKLVAHTRNEYDGYRLSYLGYDILALKAFFSRGVLASVGSQIGVGKESDIFEAQTFEGDEVVIKIHRLGRTSFRAVREKRDYMKGKSKASWLYMSRLAAVKEFAFMKALHAHDFPTPVPIDQNRHIVVMSRISGSPMSQIKTGRMYGAEHIFNISLQILRRLAEHGLVHCDFNEFNLMVDEVGTVTLIDFPQMVSTSHPNAEELFDRDVRGLVKYFAMKMRYIPPDSDIPRLKDIVKSTLRIDEEVKASGFVSAIDDAAFDRYMKEHRAAEDERGEEGSDGDSGDGYDDEEGGGDDGDDELDKQQFNGLSGGKIVDAANEDNENEEGEAPQLVGIADSDNAPLPPASHLPPPPPSAARITEADAASAAVTDTLKDLSLQPTAETGNEGNPSGDQDGADVCDDEDLTDDDEDAHESRLRGNRKNSGEGGSKEEQAANIKDLVRLKIAQERARKDTKKRFKDTRNATKKRNKYGKIVKDDTHKLAAEW